MQPTGSENLPSLESRATPSPSANLPSLETNQGIFQSSAPSAHVKPWTAPQSFFVQDAERRLEISAESLDRHGKRVTFGYHGSAFVVFEGDLEADHMVWGFPPIQTQSQGDEKGRILFPSC